MASERDPFVCRVCGTQCDTAPVDGTGAVCPEHCEDHEYEHDGYRAGWFCRYCNKEAPADWGEVDYDGQ